MHTYKSCLAAGRGVPSVKGLKAEGSRRPRFISRPPTAQENRHNEWRSPFTNRDHSFINNFSRALTQKSKTNAKQEGSDAPKETPCLAFPVTGVHATGASRKASHVAHRCPLPVSKMSSELSSCMMHAVKEISRDCRFAAVPCTGVWLASYPCPRKAVCPRPSNS